MPIVPSDPVQTGASLARAASPQASTPSSGETSPFEVFLGTGHAPSSQAPSKPAHPSRAATDQSTMPATGASHRPSSPSAPSAPSPPPPTDGSNDDSSERGLIGHSDQPVGVAADETGATTEKLPIQTSTDPTASATTNGAPIAAARDSSTHDSPLPVTAARKSDKASAKGGDASTAALPGPGPIDAATPQGAGPTIPAPAVAAPPLVPTLASAAAATPASAAPQLAAIPATAVAAVPGMVPSLGSAPGGSAATPTEPTSLTFDPTAPGREAAALGSAPPEPAPAETSGEKASNDTAESDNVAGAKPMPALASAPAPTAGTGTSSEPVQSATERAGVASAAAAAANAPNHADATLAGGTHADLPGDGPASPNVAAGPSGTASAQSAASPVAANSPVPATAAPLTAAPATSSPLSPAAVPISGLAIEIAARATRDEKSFQIRLDPPELGRIDVQLNVDASGHVTTHLMADRPETLNLLRQDASSLQRALESTGLKAGSNGLEFSLRNQSSGGEGGGQRGGQSNGSVARIIVPDEDMPAGQTATRGYGRLLGVGAGVDIRV